jgi:putative glycosyltransferase
MKLSIVATLYLSASYLPEFFRRIKAIAEQLIGEDFEIILVNDGSPDDSLSIALNLQKEHPQLQIVDLSRNFGHHAAIVAGLAHSRGEKVWLLDCDLEEQPEWLSLFMQEMDISGADVVFGVQQERVASLGSNFLGSLFWTILNLQSVVKIPHNPMTCRLMSRRYVDSLMEVGDRVLYLAGTFAWTGYQQTSITLKKIPRPVGHQSSYKLGRKLLQLIDSITSFSIAPLTLIFLIGTVIWLGAVLAGLSLLIEKILNPQMVLTGYTTVMLSIWFLGGTTILVLGVIALYISKLFGEVKRRPLYIVKNFYRKL